MSDIEQRLGRLDERVDETRSELSKVTAALDAHVATCTATSHWVSRIVTATFVAVISAAGSGVWYFLTHSVKLVISPALAFLAIWPALAHDLNEDPRASQWLSEQVNPTTGGSCCNNQDCFLTEWRSDGGKLQGKLQDGTWVDLPPEARLKDNRYGDLLLCWYNGHVQCWAMGSGV